MILMSFVIILYRDLSEHEFLQCRYRPLPRGAFSEGTVVASCATPAAAVVHLNHGQRMDGGKQVGVG